MADSPRSYDLPLAKRPRLSPESSADHSLLFRLPECTGCPAATSSQAQSAEPLVSSSTPDPDVCAGDSGFQDMDESPVQLSSSAAPAGLSFPDEASRDQQDDDEAESCASDVSGLSGEDWKPVSGPIHWVQQQIEKGSLTAREILEQLLPDTSIPQDYDNVMLWRLIVGMLSQPPKRKRLSHVHTIGDVVSLIARSKRIIVLTGAGVSVSCGIPDFRSRDGVYARLSVEFPTLPDPQSMFDIHYFRRDPRPFFKFAKEIYPGQFEPSPSHKFIKLIEAQGKLLRNYTQNIDTLEEVCGLQRVINCHGSFGTATCTKCGFRVRADQIKDDIFSQRIPLCPRCPDSIDMAVMKPDIVFFGEGLSDEFHSAMAEDKDKCDLLLVMGSSLKVRPVALIPSSIDPAVPQILINREPLSHMNFDVELLGDCDVIVQELSKRLGASWSSICQSSDGLQEVLVSGTSEATPERCASPRNASCASRSAPEAPSSTTATEATSSIAEDAVFPARTTTRKSLADGLPDNSFLFIPPSRYVFRGAEVFDSPHNDDEDDSDDSDCGKGSSGWPTASEDSGSSDSSSCSASSSSSRDSPVHKPHTSPRVSSSEWLQDPSDSTLSEELKDI